jgi:DNA-binding GntR family transcriptional regulator
MKKNKPDYREAFPRLISKIENMIILGVVQPRERLVEADLAERLKVSRAWIRDALKILETKGLVKMEPYKGAMVADLTPEEVNEIFLVRVTLERLCNKLAAENFSPEHAMVLRDLAQRIEKAYADNRLEGMIQANKEFHDYITQLSNNRFLIETLQQVRSRYYIFNTFAWSNPEMVKNILAEHNRYIAALEEKDHATLDSLAESHITYSKTLYLSQIRHRSRV